MPPAAADRLFVHRGLQVMPVTGRPSRGSRCVSAWVVPVVSAVARLILVSRLAPFDPSMPGAGRDPSWQWALNEAVPRRMPFASHAVAQDQSKFLIRRT